MGDADCVVTGERTHANTHVSPAFKEAVERLYAGTRLGRQELEGELLADAAGALWTVETIERCRGKGKEPLPSIPRSPRIVKLVHASEGEGALAPRPSRCCSRRAGCGSHGRSPRSRPSCAG